MEQRSLCSPDRICQGNSELRVVLQQLIEAHGMPAVKQVLRSIEAANLVKNTGSRGRPIGPAIDDWASLKKAAAIWRQQGGGPVWPALIAVGKSLRGEGESNARRLLSRLLSRGKNWSDKFKCAGIYDFRMAAWINKFDRAITRAGPHYRLVLVKVLLKLFGPKFFGDPFLTDFINNIPPLTLKEIMILTQNPLGSKIFPFNLILYDGTFYLALGEVDQPDKPGIPAKLEEVVFRDQDPPAKTLSVRLFPTENLPVLAILPVGTVSLT